MKELYQKMFSQRRKDAKPFAPLRLSAFVALVFVFIFISNTVLSQTDSLYHYLEIAAENNPAIRQKFNEYQAALQKIPQVGSLADPELSMGVFLTPMELVDGRQVADIRLMQMFPWFGVLRNAKDEMSLMANAKFELMRDTKLQVLYDVQRTWYELYRIQKEISISEKNIEILKIIERLALVKYKSASLGSSSTKSSEPSASNSASNNTNGTSGMQSMNPGQTSQTTNPASSSMQGNPMSSSSGGSRLVDVYSVQIEAGELENNIELLKSQKQTTVAQFNSLLNRPMSIPVSVSDSLQTDSTRLNIIAVSDSILANNPMLGMLKYESQSYEARKKMVSRMGLPMVGLGLNYSLIDKAEFPMGDPEMNGKDMLMPMVTVTLPIYRKKYNAMKNETELLKNSTAENLQSVSNSLQVEYLQAVQLFDDSRRRIKLYDKQFVLASKTLDLVMKDFSSAAAELTEVLRVRQQTFDYELKQAKAVADYYTAEAWLRRIGNMEINGNKQK